MCDLMFSKTVRAACCEELRGIIVECVLMSKGEIGIFLRRSLVIPLGRSRLAIRGSGVK